MSYFRRAASFLVCAVLFLPGYIRKELPIQSGPRKLALLVAIGSYKHSDQLSYLEGSLSDVRDIKNVLLSEKYRFHEKDIITLTNEQATHDNIRKQFIEHLINQAKPGDVAFFYFSGHGSRMEDPREISGWDNTIVPYDSRDAEGKVLDIRDKELNVLLQRLSEKTEKITVVLDSCFSGTGLRGSRRARRAPDDRRFGKNPPPLPPDAENTRDISSNISGFHARGVGYVLLAASRTDQLAFEYFENGHWHGAFTYFLSRELMRPTNRMTYRDVMERTTAAVMDVYPDQTPQVEGNSLDHLIFNDESIVPQRYIAAFPSGANRVRIEAGQAMGLTRGSTFDVYPPGTHEFKVPDKPDATIILDRIDELQSEGTIVRGSHIRPASRAVEKAHQYDSRSTRVFYIDLQRSPALQQVKGALDRILGHPTQTVDKKEIAQILFKEETNQQSGKEEIIMMGADGAHLGSALPTEAPSFETVLTSRAEAWARWFEALAIHNENSSGLLSLLLQSESNNGDASSVRFKAGSNPRLRDGDNFALTITNESTRDLFIYVLDLTDNGRISLLYPADNGVEPLHGNTSYKLSDLGVEISDAARNEATDIIKVIATTKPVPIEFLQQEPVKGNIEEASMDPITRLLFSAFHGRKDNEMPNPTVDEWDSAQIVVAVSRASK